MGAIHHLSCPQCGWTQDIFTGHSACDERRAQEALLMLETGADAANVQALLLSVPDSYMYLERAVYHCRYCGNLTERICTRLISGERALTGSYRCETCGRVMGRLHVYNLKHIACPKCGTEVKYTYEGEWDIAPAAELKQDISEVIRNVVPLATDCLRTCDAQGHTAFIPIKSERQLRRLELGEPFETTPLTCLDDARMSDGGYWVLMGANGDALLATFPAMLIRADEGGIRALENGILRAYPDICGASVRSAYIESEPFNVVNVNGREGLLAYGIWTLPEIADAAGAMRSALQSRTLFKL